MSRQSVAGRAEQDFPVLWQLASPSRVSVAFPGRALCCCDDVSLRQPHGCDFPPNVPRDGIKVGRCLCSKRVYSILSLNRCQ